MKYLINVTLEADAPNCDSVEQNIERIREILEKKFIKIMMENGVTFKYVDYDGDIQPKFQKADVTRCLEREDFETLIYYDGPQVIKFTEKRMLGIAIPCDEMTEYLMLVVEYKERDWEKYMAHKVDMRHLFVNGDEHYIIDLCKSPVEWKLTEKLMPDHLPSPGLWHEDLS